MADVTTRAIPKRPDPRAMRLALGLTGLAAVAAMATAVVRPAAPAPLRAVAEMATEPSQTAVTIRRVTRYVQLRPGETAPPGATVVQRPDPSPRTVVITIPAPPQRRVVVVTRQSGAR